MQILQTMTRGEGQVEESREDKPDNLRSWVVFFMATVCVVRIQYGITANAGGNAAIAFCHGARAS